MKKILDLMEEQLRAAFSACGRGCWLGFGIVCLILCLGAWIELRLSPFLLRALLERFF